MDLLHVAGLALLQGLTEFLPVSSSAHLVLLPYLAGWRDPGLAFDIALHVGTLAAVLLYFRRDLTRMSADWLRSCRTRRSVGESGLAWAVIGGTVPLVIGGLLFKDYAEALLRKPAVIAWATIGFGLLLGVADRFGRGRRTEHGLGFLDVLSIGCAQVLAIIPGTSRSGITMTAGLGRGLSRDAAARFSFLLSIPAIVLPGLWKTLELLAVGDSVHWGYIGTGVAVAFFSAYLCIGAFLALLDRVGMLPFVVYRLALGALLLLTIR